MFLKYISINGLGGISRIGLTFRGVMTKIDSGFPDETAFALSRVFCNRPPAGQPGAVMAGRDTAVEALIAAEGLRYRVRLRGRELELTAASVGEDGNETEATERYISFMERCAEEDRLCLFNDGSRDNRDLRAYLNEDKQYKPGELGRLTGGIAKTQSFRNELKRYLSADPVSCAYDTGLLPYLDTVRFWDSFGATRDLHYEGKPLLIVKPSPETLKTVAEYRFLLDRQVLVLT